MENIRRQVPPHPNAATGDSRPDERMLALCEKAVRHGVQAVAEEIATIYMVEITQVLALQAGNWLPHDVSRALRSLTLNDLATVESLKDKLGVSIMV